MSLVNENPIVDIEFKFGYQGRAVAQHCINGDSLSQRRTAKFDPS